MQLGATAENDVVVDQGLKAGERIVVDGILKVQPGARRERRAARGGSGAERAPPAQPAGGGKAEKAPT